MTRPSAPRNPPGFERARPPRGALLLALVPALLVLGACTSTEPTVQDPLAHASSGAIVPNNVGPSDCSPPSTTQPFEGDKLEVKGTASGGGSLWALIAHSAPVPSGTSLRIVWRMSGVARLSAIAIGPDGQQVPATGIVLASGVNWSRPGDPWNSTLEFPSPGCWRVSVQRGAVHGDVWIQVH